MASIDLATKKDLVAVKSEIIDALQKLLGIHEEKPKKEFLKGSEVKSMFDISENTLVKWRCVLGLPYSRIAGRLYYSISDIRKFIGERKISTQNFAPKSM